ncbi:MAG: hypothetical protein NT119_01455, partial [Actinobacteria bacterium]|nr:hypothetical protein [Actinomycetota bacterium]
MRLKTMITPIIMAVAISTATPLILTLPAEAQRTQEIAVTGLKLSAQNFHISTSGTLRFVFSVDDPNLLNKLMTVKNSVIRISIGARVTGGDQAVRDLISDPSLFAATDSVDFATQSLLRKQDGQFEVTALTGDLSAVVANGVTSGSQNDVKKIEFSGPGIYPIRIEALINKTIRANVTSFVNRVDLSTRLEPMPINLLVTLDSTNTLQLDGSHVVDDLTRQKISQLISLLELDGPLVSTQVSPQVIDGLSKSKNPADQELLLRLTDAISKTNLIATSYLAFDPSGARQTRHEKEFNSLVDLGKSSLSSRFTSNVAVSDVWIARTPLDQSGVDLLAESGYRSIVMLPAAGAALGTFDNTARPYRLVSGAKTMSLYVADPTYVAQLGETKNSSFITASAIAAQLLAQRSKIESDGGTPSLKRTVLTTQDGSVLNSNLIHEILLILKRIPQQISIQTLNNLPEPRQDAYKPNLRVKDTSQFKTRMNDIDLLRADLHKLNSTLDQNSSTWATWNERLMVMSSDTLTTTQRKEFATQTRNELKSLRTAVTLKEGTTFTFGSRKSQLRLDLKNSSNEDLTIQVKVESPKLKLDRSVAVIEVPANSGNELVINVVALSNGLFPVDVRIFTA